MSDRRNEFAIQVQQSGYIAPAVTVQDALIRYQMMKEFVNGVLNAGVDFGSIPGASDRPTLLKAGAEKLASFFGLRPLFIIREREDDWIGERHGGEPFFLRDYSCQLYRNGELVGEGCGSCNSWENKYRYRSSNRKCPQCGKETIIKGKAEYGGGWICYSKKGGCGAKFKDDDSSITNQEIGKVKNPDIYDQVNTIDKMAQKRALIAAVLIATNASDYFTQDVEDFIDVPFVEAGKAPENPKPEQPQQPFKESTTAGKSTTKVVKSKVAESTNAPPISISYAAAIKITNAEGKKYGDFSSEVLAQMYESIVALPEQEKTTEHQKKMRAIEVILDQREKDAAKADQPSLMDDRPDPDD